MIATMQIIFEDTSDVFIIVPLNRRSRRRRKRSSDMGSFLR